MSVSIKIFLVFILFSIAVGIGIFFKFPGYLFGYGNSYYAVYMESGEIYFGKLHRIPATALSDVYILIKLQEPNESGAYALKRLRDEQWAPKDFMRLNPEKILWITELREDGEAMKAIRGGGSSEPVLQNYPVVTS